jgi:hypothetical protein
MRRVSVVITTLTFALSGLAISPASTAEIKQAVASVTTSSAPIAIPAIFDDGVQSNEPDSAFNAVTCPSVGNCVAVGSYSTESGDEEAFTQTQTNGIWASAIAARFDDGVQNDDPEDSFRAVTCLSVGNCVAVGRFVNTSGGQEAFTQTQTNGIWANAVPATFADDVQRYSEPDDSFASVSCSSAGNCVAVGRYQNPWQDSEAFTQTLINGNWETARPATYDDDVRARSDHSYFTQVACTSVGNCVAVGAVRNSSGTGEAFTQTLINGNWEVARTATFDDGVQAGNPDDIFNSVSCTSAGNCVAAGHFKSSAGGREAFTQTQTNYSWARAVPAPFGAGVQIAAPSASAFFDSISCFSVGNCVAAGAFTNASGNLVAFTQALRDGNWETAIPATFDAGVQDLSKNSTFRMVSCSSAGNCAAVGRFINASGQEEAFAQIQTNGTWANAVPATFGDGIQNTSPDDYFQRVSCPIDGHCVAVGKFRNAAGFSEAFTQSFIKVGPSPTPSESGSNDPEVLADTGISTPTNSLAAIGIGLFAILLGCVGLRRRS